jgi:hypothetical protein
LTYPGVNLRITGIGENLEGKTRRKMGMESDKIKADSVDDVAKNIHYEPPSMKKHDPVKIVQGSASCGTGLYYTSLYSGS